MWGVFAKLFSKNCNSGEQSGESLETEDMDRAETRRSDSDVQDTYDTRQAKQKASVKWLLSKAFNNKVPENLKEPFYKDHENQDHLKPQIVGALANAEMYCLALGNIYSDPNYHNLNHWSILQTLSRKGVYLPEISDSQLTETTLIQTNPLRMNAHMAVIESIMNLYAKEVLTPDRVIAAVQRFSHDNTQPVNLENHEDGLLFWVNHTNEALMKRISQDSSYSLANGDKSDKKPPEIPKIVELKDLCDGVALAGLISYYCSEELPWTSIKVSRLPTVSDSLHNLGLVQDFCVRCLPASVFHMLPEDVTYMRGSMKKNLVVFLADLFNLLEIHPVKCVRYPGMDRPLSEGFPARNAHGVAHKRNIPPSIMTPIPDLRRGLDDPNVSQAFQVIRTPTHQPLRKTSSLQQSISDMSEDSLFRKGSEESFVVHRSRNIPTLSSVVTDEPLVPARLRNNKEKLNNDTKAEERGDDRAAGRPSNWNENKRTFAGRRSRRNSVSDDSQLTIENFGGSQDNINFIGRNPDKEVGAHIGRKISAPAGPIPIDNPAVRSTLQDARGTLQIGYDNGFEDHDTETYSPRVGAHIGRKKSASPGPILPIDNPAVRSTFQDARSTLQIGYDNGFEDNDTETNSSRVGGHVGRKISAPSGPIDNPAIRSSIQDARGTLQLGYDNGFEKHEMERENFKLKRQLSNDDIRSRYNMTHERNKENILQDLVDGEISNRMSFADLNKKAIAGDPGGIQLVYMQQDKEGTYPSKSSFLNKANNTNGSEKKTSFATLPNTTTWQQQSNNQQQAENSMTEEGRGDQVMASQLNDIRMKLEEKRRHIENEKRRTEMAMNKQRQKVGKAAFLQAVVKGKGGLVKSSSDVMVDSLMSTIGSEPTSSTQSTSDSARANDKPSRPIALKDVPDDIVSLEKKWMDDAQPFIETRKTPDMENMDLETYQKSISHMNSSLQDIQADIQRLASQQNQIQLAQQQQLLAQQQKQLLQQQHGFHNQIPSYTSQQSYNPQYSQQGNLYAPLQSSASAPHIPQSLYQQSRIVPEPQFFLHNQEASPAPQPPQRRTWAQQVPQVHSALDESYQPELRTWGKPQNPSGFILHETSSDRYQDNRYHNGSGDHSLNHSNFNTSGFTLSQQHQLFGNSNNATPSTSPQHRQHRQLSQLMDNKRASPVSLQNLEPVRPERKSNLAHAPTPPTIDDMAPQSISFIGSDEISESLSRLNITSGSRTYRIPSPTRPVITRNSFQPTPSLEQEQQRSNADVVSLASSSDPSNQKGFYISFDNEQPKRPKPPLRTKKGGSPKKERSYIEDEQIAEKEKLAQEKVERRKLLERELEEERIKKENEQIRKSEQVLTKNRVEPLNQERNVVSNASAIIIGNDLSNPDPDLLDEQERKKERILMMSLQRRQQQEEAKAKKEAEAQAWREREKAKQDDKMRKKEEQAARRAAILEHHKMKKAIEEAEREGKDVDKALINATLKPNTKLRQKGSTGRPRPKTIHIDSGSVEMAEGMLNPARGKRGSNSNLTANSYNSSTMKRDYYRGSQDSLSSGMMYKDSPDDSRGMSPCHSANQTLGRRSSYKTSRDPSPAQTRGRSKYSTYQNFKGRKSNSMMNLYGSSTDQDSFAYRYGDTDSGLGRATPPRRAPSPGMGPMRHLPSPSGPGSLPGLVSKRRVFDDGSSDISSTPSSMMDYTGPRLYKQPATKSNRGIMLNAVEYCVFPGVVNREAKTRVLEEIARSESKHFLILFRDAGCQFRALYSYCPDREEVAKLYGTGPKQVNDRMFDKFFKYNSGGKCFAVVHTKHLTVTIDAFTIHNSLWQGKKVNLPSKKDMTLVI